MTFCPMALNTGIGPGTIVGGNIQARISHATNRLAMDRTLGNVVITNEVRRYNFDHAVADDVVHQLQVIVL